MVYRLKVPSVFIYHTIPDVDISGISLQRCKTVSMEYSQKIENAGNLTLGGYYKTYDREFRFRKPGSAGYPLQFCGVNRGQFISLWHGSGRWT